MSKDSNQIEYESSGERVIDDFSRGTLDPYESSRDVPPWNFDIHSGDRVYSGDHSLEVQTAYDGRGIISKKGTGEDLNYYPERGGSSRVVPEI